MAEINGLVYIIVGLFCSISSWILDSSRGESNLTFFVIVGGIMILVGAIKLLAKSGGSHHKPGQVIKKYCHRCGGAVHSFQEFCHKCGSRMHR